jgi:hypothetical protein
LVSNHIFYGSIFSEGYSARDAANEWSAQWLHSIPAFFLSPARGFLFLSPPLLLGFYGMYKKFRENNVLFIFLALGYICSMLLIGKWYAWHGANAFGSRMLVDYLPFLGLFAFIEFNKLKKAALVVIIFLMIYSVFIHTNAVIFKKSRCGLDHNWSFYCLQLPTRQMQY